jgi:lipopolysaccharide transport system ATP-binding protein
MLFAGGRRGAVIGPAETLCKDYINQIYDDPTRYQEVEKQRSLQLQVFQQKPTTNTTKVLKSSAAEKNIYTVTAFRCDAEHFGNGGATISNVGFFDADKNLLSTLKGGQSVDFIISLCVNQKILYPAIGLMIKDRLGQYIFTEGTDKSFRQHKLVFFAGQQLDIVFSFSMPILACGKYSVNVAVAEGLGDEHIQHHWIHDAVIIESISSPVVHGIGGLQNCEMSMEFTSQAGSAQL